MAQEAYGDALLSAARETGFDESAFPQAMPWTLTQALDSEYLPE
jgi:phenylalanine-4-hydroxylase